MNNNPLFSVLIANYNNGRYLQQAINSVLEQTYSNWEIVLVDDKSTDNSHEIYEKYKDDRRFRIYYNDVNGGCGYTKRRCVELAQGELCGFLDPDDALTKEALEIMVKEHCNHENVSLVYSRYYLSDQDLNIIGESKHQRALPEGVTFLDYGKGAVSHFATFKLNNYKRTTGINPYMLRAVDHDLYYKLEETGAVLFKDVPLYIYRTGATNSISLGRNTYVAAFWDIISQYEACRRRNCSPSYYEQLMTRDLNCMLDKERKKGESFVRYTKTYRIGKIMRNLLNPIKMFQR